MSYEEKEELKFCKEKVLKNKEEFVKYGHNGIIQRCENLVISGENEDLISKRYYYLKDYLGSVVGLTDGSGKILIEYDYDSYGKAYVKIGSGEYISFEKYNGNKHNNTRLYTAREWDEEIGLYYYRARYYDPRLGRFISRDPIGQTDDLNLYVYVGNSPVMFVDPSGEVKKIIGNDSEIPPTGDLKNSNNGKSLINYFGDILMAGGGALSAVTAPSCAGSINVAGGCIILASPTGIGEVVCVAPVITAGASCGATAAGAGIAGLGYMLSSAGGGKGDGGKGNKGGSPDNPMSSSEALDEMEKFLGKNYKEVEPGVFRSLDDKRQARIGNNDITGEHAGGPHINLEDLLPNPKKPGKIMPANPKHLYFKD